MVSLRTTVVTVIATFGFASTLSIQAAELMSLENFFRLSEARNQAYQQVLLEEEINRPAARAAWGQFLPSLQVGYGIEQSSFYNPTYINPDGSVATFPRADTIGITPEIDTVIISPIPEGKRRNSSAFLQIQELLFDGGNNYFNLKNSGIQKEIRACARERERFRLRTQVTQSYAQAIAATKMRDLANSVLEQRRLQLEFARTRFETGTVTKRDVMQAEVDLGRAINDSLNSLFTLRQSFENLSRLAGLPLDNSYELTDLPPPFKPSWSPDSLTRAALSSRGDYRAAAFTTNLRRNELRAAHGAHLPLVSAYLAHSRNEPSGSNVNFTLTPRNRYTSIGLNASWQVFDRFTRDLRAQDAGIKRRQAELKRSELALEVELQIRAALDRLQLLYQQTQVAGENQRWAEETFKFEQERYRLGTGTVIELGAAQLSLVQAHSDQIRIETEFQSALGELELATGMILRNR